MKKQIVNLFFLLIFGFVSISSFYAQSSYENPVNTSKWLDPSVYKKEMAKVFRESIFSSIETLDFVSFDSDIFEIGEGTESITAKRTVYPFSINKYETSYELWYSVRAAAESMFGYYFENPGQEGSMGRRGRAPTENKNHPVTTVTWYDVIVWCNAFSELCGYKPVYSYNGEVLRDSSMTYEIDLCECDFSANGFRLPTETEWEYAARFNPNNKTLEKNKLELSNAESGESWSFLNASSTNPVATAGKANCAGLFDMSGNVLEYCFDWFGDYLPETINVQYFGVFLGSERVSRGGSFSEYTPFLNSGDRYSYDPNEYYGFMGFRIAQSK